MTAFSFAPSVTMTGVTTEAVMFLPLALLLVGSAPVAVSTYVHVFEDGVVHVKLSATAPGKFSLVRSPQHGGVKIDEDTGDMTYTPSPDWSGLDEVRFAVTDDLGYVSIGSAHIDVVAVNDPPVAQSASLLVPHVGLVSVHLRGHDVETPALKYVLVDEPALGAAKLDAKTGELVYRTDGRQSAGVEKLRFYVFDGELRSAMQTVTIEVR